MPTAVHTWWIVLCVVAVLNIAAWSVSAAILVRRRGQFSAAEYRLRRLLLWLSAAYVAGCAFRSSLPRIDLERICLLDTWLSGMVIGRSVATLAELCFIAQCALVLYWAGNSAGHRFTTTVSSLLVPLIVAAEAASWYAILSKNYFGHLLENSIWTFAAALLLVSCILLRSYGDLRQRRFLTAMGAFIGGYILFMLSIDLPMYWSRWNAAIAARAEYLSLLQGFADASQSCIVSFDWRIWREEIPWMTLYFTTAVWMSIALPHAPLWHGSVTVQRSAAPPAGAAARLSRATSHHAARQSAKPTPSAAGRPVEH